MPTDHPAQPWAIRSTLVAVADLDRSVDFYRDIGPFDEIAREDAVAVVGDAPATSIVLILRETKGTHHIRHGQQSLGLRSITFNVGSLSELDRIESVLRGRDVFTSRQKIADGACGTPTRTGSGQLASRVRLLRPGPNARTRLLPNDCSSGVLAGRPTRPPVPSRRSRAIASPLFHQKILPVGGDPSSWPRHGLVEGMMLRGCEARPFHVLVCSVVPKPILAGLEAADDDVA